MVQTPYLILTILYISILPIYCSSLNSFSKSLYASIKPQKNIDLQHIKPDSKIEPDYLILKYEDSLNNYKGSLNNHMSLFISSKYYHNVICLDPTEKTNFYTLKNTILKHVSTFHYKVSDSYTVIEDKNNYCLERLEYIDEDLNLDEKNIFLNKNYWYNLINGKPLKDSPSPLIEHLTNISLFEMNKEIIENYNKISKWNKDNSYELVFVYDNIRNKFLLQKVFIYFIKNKNYNYDCVIDFKKNKFENIIIEYNNKLYQNFDFKKEISDNFLKNDEYKMKITTNKKDSVYHNLMSLTFDDKTLDNLYNKNGNKDICYLIHYVLTEDAYIERNEFMTRFKEILDAHGVNQNKFKNIKYELYASKFIEQELSSDLSEQAYFSFVFCANKEVLKLLKNTISYTIHFRYQPSLKANSTKTHQTVVMPQPFILVVPGDAKIDKTFLNDIIHKNNLFYGENNLKDKLKLFEEEIKIKKLRIINQVNIFNENYKELIHEIPGGQMKYFWNITLTTSIVSCVGFLIIFMGVMNYISPEEIYDKSTIPNPQSPIPNPQSQMTIFNNFFNLN